MFASVTNTSERMIQIWYFVLRTEKCIRITIVSLDEYTLPKREKGIKKEEKKSLTPPSQSRESTTGNIEGTTLTLQGFNYKGSPLKELFVCQERNKKVPPFVSSSLQRVGVEKDLVEGWGETLHPGYPGHRPPFGHLVFRVNREKILKRNRQVFDRPNSTTESCLYGTLRYPHRWDRNPNQLHNRGSDFLFLEWVSGHGYLWTLPIIMLSWIDPMSWVYKPVCNKSCKDVLIKTCSRRKSDNLKLISSTKR